MIRRPPRSTRTEHSFPTRRSSDLAGMGIGLMFYGVAEPMSHYSAAMGGVTLDASGARTDWAPLGGAAGDVKASADLAMRSEEHTSELQSLMRISYAVFCLKKKKKYNVQQQRQDQKQVIYIR